MSGTTLVGKAQPVLVKATGQLGTASTAKRFAGADAVDRLRAQNRQQTRRIATLEREVTRLSGR